MDSKYCCPVIKVQDCCYCHGMASTKLLVHSRRNNSTSGLYDGQSR